MKATTIIASLSWVAAVLAAPLVENAVPAHIKKSVAAGAPRERRTSRPLNKTMSTTTRSRPSGKIVHDQTSSNWAGAVLIGNGYNSVSGKIVAVAATEPPGASPGTQYTASAWVGIDGDTCDSAIIQTGIDMIVQDGRASFDAWYEWYPDYSYSFGGITINAGDTISMSVTATSANSGIATVENLSNGQSVSHDFENQSGNLCMTNAEWIVEDASNGYGLIPFADFGTVTFTDAVTTSGGTQYGPNGGTIFQIVQDGQQLTSCSSGYDTVSCTYV